ncbi:hypothetical protein E4U50_000513 [Claviceps purpurea]|nr:hypothetical protein E4U50_000513 [Claviceps purpurea]
MDAGEALPLALPDFALVADGLALAVEHVRRCTNLPAVDIEPLANQLAAMTRRQNTFELDVRGMLQREFVIIRRRLEIFNLNTVARQKNNVLGEAQPLVPLYSLVTGQLIPDFPETLLAIDALPAPQVNAILVELEEGIETRVTVGRKKLERAVGVVMRHR